MIFQVSILPGSVSPRGDPAVNRSDYPARERSASTGTQMMIVIDL